MAVFQVANLTGTACVEVVLASRTELCPRDLVLRTMTTSEAGPCELPLLVMGLPAPIGDCLRAGGVPFVSLEAGGRVRGRRGRRPPRFMLYDSRDSGCRRDVERLRLQNLVPIDLAACLARAVAHRAAESEPAGRSPAINRNNRKLSCRRLLSLLKQTVEHAGGLWARVPEVPFPRQYDPPLWRPTPTELQAWRKIRSRIRLEVSRAPDAYRIVAVGEFGEFRPAIELWRGRHVASFELRPGETTLPLGGLVYQQRSERSAESTAVRADDSHIASNSGWIKPQSA